MTRQTVCVITRIVNAPEDAGLSRGEWEHKVQDDLNYYQSVIDAYVAARAQREERAELRAAIAVLTAYAVSAFALGFWTLFLIGMGG